MNSEKWSVNLLAKELNVHTGTIKRWIDLKKVPVNYFRDLNKLTGFQYEINVDENKKYKLYDMFFTHKKLAKKLVEQSLNFIKTNYEIDLSEYTILEPSAGEGSFTFNFPKNIDSISIDIEPKHELIQKMDFFDFKPNNEKKYIVIGNPPFGLRGQLALKFMNFAAEFADFICFVLPPLFNSNGKGSPMLRVSKKIQLVKEFAVENNFHYPNKKKISVNAIFQIWTRLNSKKVKIISTKNKKSDYIKVVALSDGEKPSNKRNVKLLDSCDLYLPSTTFNKIESKNSFIELPNKRGYGVIILKERKKVEEALKRILWSEVSFKSTNGANNLRTQIILDALEKEMENNYDN
ncbi:restriction endonuclease subunit M [Mycoplasma nasistruthionis]|uniref:Restriction endonuclease subunit M n=1 Tax=Mycoplasma nasistruthionis TaxID=353852 RepID=A0A4Y6I5N8_9MOLU|nr:restriction endonuclease subunit M [Mycoplasma nasistruthionis]